MKNPRVLLATLALIALAGCANISTFDRTAYEKATDAKAASLIAMSRAGQPWISQQAIVTPLLLRVEEAREYDRGRAKNSVTVQQWDILLDPERRLLGGFVRRWQEGRTYLPDAIRLFQADTARAFDTIIALERGKRIPTEPSSP